MIVTVVDRAATEAQWGHPGPFTVITETVEIDDTCPICGGPRGEPELKPFCEDGHHYSAHCWTNPCGHLDRYESVLREAAQLLVRRAADNPA
jgi:hypothetical protein